MDKLHKVSKIDGGLAISSEVLDEMNRSHDFAWDMLQIDKKRFLLFPEGVHKDMGDHIDGLGRCSSNSFSSLLTGLCNQGFTGTIVVDNGRGVKKIHLKQGEICFAASNLIDDRLGEIIYRRGLITIEEMAQSSVKVNRTTKFGAVLLKNGIFSTIDLWEALKLQVKEIIRSVFLVNKVYYHIQEGKFSAPTAIAFENGSTSLVEELTVYGDMFRLFLESLTENPEVRLKKESAYWVEPEEGTFYFDISQLISKYSKLSDIVTFSKLKDINTYMVLFDLFCREQIEVSLAYGQVEVSDPMSQKMAVLHGRYKFVNSLLKEVVACFQKEEVAFPYQDVKKLVRDFIFRGGKLFDLTDQGEIALDSFILLGKLCETNHNIYDEALVSFNCLTRFILQLSGDLLSRESSKGIRDMYGQ